MKVLIVNGHPGGIAKWVEPLRKEGWGILCVRTPAEAEKVIEFHGNSLQSMVLHREQAGGPPDQTLKWFSNFKKTEVGSRIPTLLISSVWTERDFLKQQNGEASANAYLSDVAPWEDLKNKILSFQRKPEKVSRVASANPSKVEIELEEISGILNRPEATRSGVNSISLAAPQITLGGVKTSTGIRTLPSRQADEENKTVMIETSQFGHEPGRPEVEAMPESISGSFSEEEFTPIAVNAGLDFGSPQPSKKPSFEIDFGQARVLPEQSANPSVNPSVTPPRAPPSAPNLRHVFDQLPPIPESATASSDVGTLKNYLAMREHDVAVLSGQVRSAQERIQQLENQIRVERARSIELQHTAQRHEQTIRHFNQDKQVEFETLMKQVEELTDRLKEKNDRVRLVESKLKVATDEFTKIKERVRVDIRRIRVREKELEAQLEILKKDSSALLMARDEKIIELKRKIDLLEFNMELVQEQYGKERNSADQLKQRLKDAATAMKQAGGILNQET